MAGLTAGGGTIGSHLLHSLFELPLVRVVVATGAVQVFPVVDHRRFWLEFGRFLVALSARSRQVSACQREMGLLVFSQSKSRGLVCLQVVTAVACVEVRSGGKLSRVLITMAVGAPFEFHFEDRVFPLRNVALGTL